LVAKGILVFLIELKIKLLLVDIGLVAE